MRRTFSGQRHEQGYMQICAPQGHMHSYESGGDFERPAARWSSPISVCLSPFTIPDLDFSPVSMFASLCVACLLCSGADITVDSETEEQRLCE